MAKSAAAAEAAPAKKGPSLVIQIVMLLVLVGVGLGGGWFVGGYLKGQVPPPAPAAEGEGQPKAGAEAAGGHGEAAAGGGHGEAAGGGGHGEEAAEGGHGEAVVGEDGKPVPTQTLFDLAPITTNLAAPNDVWARLEVAIEFDTPPADPNIVEIVHQDLLSYLRTVKMHQLEGASGIQHLRADLQDRASIRTGGHVKGVFIRTLLFE